MWQRRINRRICSVVNIDIPSKYSPFTAIFFENLAIATKIYLFQPQANILEKSGVAFQCQIY